MPRLRSVLRRAAGRFIPRFAPPVKCLTAAAIATRGRS